MRSGMQAWTLVCNKRANTFNVYRSTQLAASFKVPLHLTCRLIYRAATSSTSLRLTCRYTSNMPICLMRRYI